MSSVFEQVKDDNKLLKAVYFDLQVLSHIAGCRALGLINKFVTAPLWRLLETDIHILDLNSHFQRMEKLFSDLSFDATNFLNGKVLFFPDMPVSKDDVFNKLIMPSSVFDESTKQCLELMFGCFSIVTKRMLSDHLEGGKYDNPSKTLRNQTDGVLKTNTLAERNFGMLDRLMREKPHANQITYEAIIMSQTNKMSEWRDNLSSDKRAKLMKWARESSQKQYIDFKQRRAEVRKKQNENRLNKIELKKNRELKALLVKQNLVVAVGKFGGLWLSVNDVDKNISILSTEAKKREALKVQFQFRQKILPSLSIDKKLFHLSEKGKNKSIEVLCVNLKSLITFVNNSTAEISVEFEEVDITSIVIPKNKLDAEKDRLKSLLAIECNKLHKKSNNDNIEPPKAKKVKSNCIEFMSDIPIISCMEELIGKKVEHFTFDIDGSEKWFSGVVICPKPGTQSELVIRYDCERNQLYSFDYSEFTDSLVKLIPLKPTSLVGEKIRQKCTNDEASDIWWETGVILDVEKNTENPEFTVNFYDCNNDNEKYDDEDFPNAYEVCKFLLLDDYLNNDIQFV